MLGNQSILEAMPPNGAITRIVIADDHPVVMLGIRALLRDHGGMQVVGEAGNGRELLALMAGQPCDLLITDFSMPYEDGSGDGLSLLRRVRRDHPCLPMIVLTMVHNPALTRGMLATGVEGLVAKAAMVKELQLAASAVLNGRTYICEAMREHVLDWSPSRATGESDGGADPAVLSQREAEVVRLYAQGLSVTQIA